MKEFHRCPTFTDVKETIYGYARSDKRIPKPARNRHAIQLAKRIMQNGREWAMHCYRALCAFQPSTIEQATRFIAHFERLHPRDYFEGKIFYVI